MDNEKIMEIWKVNAVKQIESYTDAEIVSIVLKSARRAIDRSFYGAAFWGGLAALLLGSFLIRMTYSHSPELRMYTFIVAAIVSTILIVAMIIHERGRRKAKRYSFDVPLKEWIEFGVRDFDKGIERFKRAWFLKYGFGVLFLAVFIVLRILVVGFSLRATLIGGVVGLLAMTVASVIGNRAMLKRMTESRDRLRELYDQLRES